MDLETGAQGQREKDLSVSLAITWFVIGLVLTVIAAIHSGSRKGVDEVDYYMWGQDIGVLAAVAALLFSLRWAPQAGSPSWEAFGRRPATLVFCLAIGCAVFSWAGHRIVFENFALSRDEDLALFHASSIAAGHLIAQVPIEWREFATALQPRFMIRLPSNPIWLTAYLPINAGLQAIGTAFGDPSIVSPILGAIALAATYGVGLKLWPERPAWALVPVALLATSSQFLVTAMTPYAMTGHLALNMVWLWLHLRGGRLGHVGAVVIGFLACGLHQLIFHPLFVAPFILQLFAERRFRLGLFYTVGYAAICLFWTQYWSLVIHVASVPPSPAGPAAPGVWRQAADLIRAFDVGGFGVMAKNVVRFVTWQNPLVAPLVAMSASQILKAKGTIRSLFVGVMLSLFAMLILLPYQGAGWGYRYLHGFLGSVCLLAAWSLSRLMEGLDRSSQQKLSASLLLVTALTAFVLLPLRLWQTREFIHPYASASRFIQTLPADVVLVDDFKVWQGVRLIRNDPLLSRRPITMHFADLTPLQIRDLCVNHTVALFSPSDAARFGLWAQRASEPPRRAREAANRAELAALGCRDR